MTLIVGVYGIGQFETQHGFFFTGRRTVMSALVDWLVSPDPPYSIVVTGQPGCGKSAVLSRLVTLSDRQYRSRIEASLDLDDPVPPLDSVFCSVRCSAKRLDDLISEIAAHFGRPDIRTTEELIEAIGTGAIPRVIVIDAVDEALDPETTARALLVPLSRAPGIRLLVGTREQGVEPLEPGPGFKVLDLDHPGNLGIHDIADYVRKILVSEIVAGQPSPYVGHPQLATDLAESIARRTSPIFLVARIVACSLLAESELVTDFDSREYPVEVGAAFGEYLSRFGEETPLIRDVLTALAFAQGAGLPWESIWPAIITAVTGRKVTGTELASAVERAGALIVEDNEADRPVYRLFHEALADHLRAPYNDRLTAAHRSIADALTRSVESDERVRTWPLAHPYLRRHLARHAALGGYLDTLLRDPWFVVNSRPEDILGVLPPGGGRDIAGIYKSVVHRIGPTNPSESLSYLEMAAQQIGATEAFDWSRAPVGPRRWRPLWAMWEPDPVPQWVITGHADDVTTLAVLSGKRTVIASGGWDGTVLLRDLATGMPLCEPLQHRCQVRAIAFSRVHNRDVVITAPYGGAIRMWFLDDASSVTLAAHELTTAMVSMSYRGHPAIAFGTIMGELAIVDLASRKIVASASLDPSSVHALAVHELERPILTIFGHAGAVWSWQPEKSSPPTRFPPIPPASAHISAATATMVAGKPVVVTDGKRCVALWNPAKRERIAEIPLPGEAVFVTTASTGESVIAVAGSHDGVLHIIDLERREVVRSLKQPTAVTSGLLAVTEHGPTLITGHLHGVLRVRELGHDIFAAEDAVLARPNSTRGVAIASDNETATVAFIRKERLELRDAESGEAIPHDLSPSAPTYLAAGAIDAEPVLATMQDRDLRLAHARTGRELRSWTIEDEGEALALLTVHGESCIVTCTRAAITIFGTSQTSRIDLAGDAHDRAVMLSSEAALPYALYSDRERNLEGMTLLHLEKRWRAFFPEMSGACVAAFEHGGHTLAIRRSGDILVAQKIGEDGIPDERSLELQLPKIGKAGPVRTIRANGRLYLIGYGPDTQLSIAEVGGAGSRLTIDIGAQVTSITATASGYVAIGTDRGLQMLRISL